MWLLGCSEEDSFVLIKLYMIFPTTDLSLYGTPCRKFDTDMLKITSHRYVKLNYNSGNILSSKYQVNVTMCSMGDTESVTCS